MRVDSHKSNPLWSGGEWKLSRSEVESLYLNFDSESATSILPKLGPLERVFSNFIENERSLTPLDDGELIALFDSCTDPNQHVPDIIAALRKLAPGKGHVGFRQVNTLISHLRQRVHWHAEKNNLDLDLLPHDDTFGSGGDYSKTMHATTAAAIIVAPKVTICKTGTTNVTSPHGSTHFIAELGYKETANLDTVNRQLREHGFAYVSLATLGFPYSTGLKAARMAIWVDAMDKLREYQMKNLDPQQVLPTLDITLDIFKVVSPNARVLDPVHHSTGVSHLSMIPYVLATYLFSDADHEHRGQTGVISHCYCGIDEISNAGSDAMRGLPNNLVVRVEREEIVVAEFSPEDVGMRRVGLMEISSHATLAHEVKSFWNVLLGEERGAIRDFLAVNAALLLIAGKATTSNQSFVSQLRAAIQEVQIELLEMGLAYRNLVDLLHHSV
jgi:anthranilate phosphoribosyltransferase